LLLWDSRRFLKWCNRIVHVGANSGEERELYDSYGLSVVWVEPIPAVYEELVRNIEPYPKQMAIQALLTDRAEDTVQFNVANNSGASSSILDLALHRDIWPEVSYVDQIRLRTETLDRVLAEHGIGLRIDALILDTQGSELLVLKGADAVLRQTVWLKVEAADFESYKGGATVETIREFLKGYSFRLVRTIEFAKHPSGGKYYDLLFKRSTRRVRWIGDGRTRSLGAKIKAAARYLLDGQTIGMVDYYRYPERRNAWGGPFNGQVYRRQLFESILSNVRPGAIVETGTHIGTTTEFMAGAGFPIYTIEGHPRNHGYARARLWRKRNVTARLGDSRTELRALFEGPLRSMKHEAIFFYLDAHWNHDLPLAEELDIICSRCSNAVVMVDDFEVPGDSGFGYDDYGVGKVLTADYLVPATKSHSLALFYPAYSSAQETGARRGCVVLCNDTTTRQVLNAISLLRTDTKNDSQQTFAMADSP
jgi:FkbM family methyltransferase